MNTFQERLKELRIDKNINMDKFSKDIGYSKTIVYYWETGQRKPNSTALTILANYFNVTVDYLIGNDDAAVPHSANVAAMPGTLSDDEKELLKVFRGLSETGKKTLIGSAHNIEKYDPQATAKKKA